ncbi:hypothetical protein AAIH70_15810 [Neorhizobium sp. BT27B]|uniref:hypothetical protein n=1 Tax=Neorhizobium sp. BT27B TaxID=3142625 RepID=UPI003D2D4CE5
MTRAYHPYRYQRNLSLATTRIEAVLADNPDRLAAEFDGLSDADLCSRREILNHVEALIADWKADGSCSFDAELVLDSVRDVEGWVSDISDEIGHTVTYVNFGPASGFSVGTAGEFIEGMYFREAYCDGKAGLEITFSCDGPSWNSMHTDRYAAVLLTASRTATCFRTESEGAVAVRWLHGDSALIAEPAIQSALAAADIMLTIFSSPAVDPTPLVAAIKFH